MKKFIALLLIAVLVMSLAGCCIPLNECDLCGEVGLNPERKVGFSGNKYPVCNDCYREYSYLFD